MVEHGGEGGPTIAAGTPLTRAHLRQWTEALGRAAPPQILPHNVLVAHRDMLAWWTPEQVRPAYFDLSTPPAGLRVLAQRTIRPVPYPAQLFVATPRRLGVYALAENERPSATTRVLHSPVLNVFVDGSLCWGNIPRPRTLDVAAIPDFERALFDSWSTHPNPGQELTVTGKGGLLKLWDDLAARQATRKATRQAARQDGVVGQVRRAVGRAHEAPPSGLCPASWVEGHASMARRAEAAGRCRGSQRRRHFPAELASEEAVLH